MCGVTFLEGSHELLYRTDVFSSGYDSMLLHYINYIGCATKSIRDLSISLSIGY